MATDTFSEFMGVRCDPLAEPIAQGLTKMTGPAWPVGTGAADAANGYVISTKLNDAFRAVSLLLDKGVTVRRVPSGDGFTPGDFVVTGGSTAVIREVAKQTGVDFAALTSPVPTGAYPVRKPRIAMYQRYLMVNRIQNAVRLSRSVPRQPRRLLRGDLHLGDRRAKRQLLTRRPAQRRLTAGLPTRSGRHRSTVRG